VTQLSLSSRIAALQSIHWFNSHLEGTWPHRGSGSGWCSLLHLWP
jgi:hypothetical protein